MAVGKWSGVTNSLYNRKCSMCPVIIKKDDICFYDWGVITCHFCSPEADAEFKAQQKEPILPVIGSHRPWYEVEEAVRGTR